MNETMRDRLKRRVRWCIAVDFGGWLLFVLGTTTASRQTFPILNIVGSVLFGGAILAIQWLVRCPRCSVRLGQVAFTLAIPGLKPQPNFCPYCGVSLDEAPAQPASTTYNPIM